MIVQQFQVRPSELVREQPYLERNINATRAAYDIADSEVTDYPGTVSPPTPEVLDASAGTLNDIRLLDPAVVSPTFNQLQQIRGYYSFNNKLDVDRYTLDDGQARRHRRVARDQPRRHPRRPAQLDQRPPRLHARLRRSSRPTTTRRCPTASRTSSRATSRPPASLDVDQPRVYFGEL